MSKKRPEKPKDRAEKANAVVEDHPPTIITSIRSYPYHKLDLIVLCFYVLLFHCVSNVALMPPLLQLDRLFLF